ncbi:hypothetical protein IW262DRAFT_1507425 [Armillaria fumosa]|nr:hypothetical protein IW262DRAFT_1507425 [Armillaria fumosa]
MAPPFKRTRVEDVEDEEDMSSPPEHYIQDFLWEAGDLIIEQGVLPPFFEQLRHERFDKNEEMWAPFSSRDEWELVQWLLRSGISQKEIDTFLKLESIKNNINPSFENKRKLFQTIDRLPTGPSWSCKVFEIRGDLLDEKGNPHIEEVELWKRDPVECVKELIGDARFCEHLWYAPEHVYTNDTGSSQVYSEMAMADWWWNLQKLLPKGVTIAPIILASDKTQLSHFSNDKLAWLVYLTIGNIDKDIRRKPSKHATVLIGYLPVSKLECFSKKHCVVESYQLFHTFEAGKAGVEMLCADGQTRLIYPILAAYVADYPEQCLVACCMENRCPICKSKSEELGEPLCSPLQDQKETMDILKQASEGLDPPEFMDWGLHLVNPFWVGLLHCNIFQCFTPDILHQLHKGVFKDHVVKWATAAVEAMTCHPSLHHFKKGISLISQWMGNEYKSMERVFLSVIMGAADESVTKSVRAILDFIYFSHYEEHTTESLKKLEDSWLTFHEEKAVFVKLGIRSHFNIPKIHAMSHYVSMICNYGSAGGYNTEASEHLHIDYAKIAYNTSNKKDYIRQMTTWMRQREAVEKFQRFLQYAVDEYCEAEEQADEEDEEDNMDVDGNVDVHGNGDHESIISHHNNHNPNPSVNCIATLSQLPNLNQFEYGESMYSIPKGPAYTNVSIDTLTSKFGASEFLYAMEAFLHNNKLLQANYWDAVPATYSVYKWIRILIPPTPEVTQFTILDPVHATLAEPALLARKNYPCYNWSSDPLAGLHLGTFHHPLAYVEWFTPLCKVDSQSGMFQIQYSAQNRCPNASIIPVTYLARSCHLTPCSGDNILDTCKAFNLNLYLRHIDFVLLRDKCITD